MRIVTTPFPTELTRWFRRARLIIRHRGSRILLIHPVRSRRSDPLRYRSPHLCQYDAGEGIGRSCPLRFREDQHRDCPCIQGECGADANDMLTNHSICCWLWERDGRIHVPEVRQREMF